MLKGIGASPGIAIGKALVKTDEKIEVKKNKIENVIEEIDRLSAAINIAKEQIEKLYHNTLNNIGEDEARIFEAHLMLLEDPELLGKIKDKVIFESINAEYALKEVTESFIMIFEKMDNEYMKERVADLKDVSTRVTNILLGVEMTDLSRLEEEVIIIAKDLTPSDTAQMDKEKVIGFLAETGGKTSHSAIMARTLEIPAVVGVEGIANSVENGDMVVFDGDNGKIFINPDNDIIKKYQEKRKEFEFFKGKLKELIGVDSTTKDGIKVELAANIGTPKDVEGILRNDGEGIGLYRTEFLYIDRDRLPSEDEQFEAYREVAERLKGKPVVIRTLDIGGDKELPYLELPKEMNPFLGYRAIRLCLDRIDIFTTQLRALLRASAYGDIKIMFPMISSIEELREAKKILEGVKVDLRKENKSFNEDIEVGIMIEIPAAAIISDLFAKEVDFLSIGTNDLIQYTTAVDRMNQSISYLYNPFHPALLRLIKMVIDNGHNEGIWVGMCGEVAGDPKLIPILIGMGLDEFSMSPGSILKARWIIKQISKKEMEELVNQALIMPTAKEVEQFVNENIRI